MPDGVVRGLPRPIRPVVEGGAPPDVIYTPKGGEIIIDEFDDAKIDSAWTRVDKSSSSYVTWTESGGVMSAFHTSDADTGGDAHCLMRELPAGTTYPVTIELYCHATVARNVNYMMMGAMMSDGLALTGTAQACSMAYTNSSSELSLYADLRTGDGYNINTQAASSGLRGHASIGNYHHLRWTTTNTFQYCYSSDGVSWNCTATGTKTLTPTHVGIWVSNWGNAIPLQVGFEYFRVYTTEEPLGNADTL